MYKSKLWTEIQMQRKRFVTDWGHQCFKNGTKLLIKEWKLWLDLLFVKLKILKKHVQIIKCFISNNAALAEDSETTLVMTQGSQIKHNNIVKRYLKNWPLVVSMHYEEKKNPIKMSN